MRRIAITSSKGGVGKTTTAISLAVSYARGGAKVLILDCDAQSNLTDWLGVKRDETPGLFGFLTAGLELDQVAVEVEENLHLVPASRALSGLDAYLLTRPRPADVLRKRLEPVTGFDAILFDCPPSFSQVTLNAMMASSEIVVPVSMEHFAIEGLAQTLETVRLLREEADHRLIVRAVVPTFYDSRNRKSAAVVDILKKKFGDRVTTPVRTSVRLSEAPSHRLSIFDYSPDSPGAQDYTAIALEMSNANN